MEKKAFNMSKGIVSTIGQMCKRCYSCIRECPTSAIRVENGQAVVIAERCISCGHCVKVCSQHAKKIESEVEYVMEELLPNFNCVAIIAPSFAASFPDDYKKIPGAIRNLGFNKVAESAFGADLVSNIYKEYLENNPKTNVISSPCPAIYSYIEKYFVELVPNLAPIVSPMVAMGRYLKANNEDIKVVFIGPCIAKKNEYKDSAVEGAIDAVLTFTELKEILKRNEIILSELEDSKLDPPYASLGKSYALPGGLLKTAELDSDILTKETIVVDGKEKVKEIIQEISDGKIEGKFVDILFCEGCISGPAIDSSLNFYSRREKIIDYIGENLNSIDKSIWKSDIYNNRDLNLRREFVPQNRRRAMPSESEIESILAKTNKFHPEDELNCGACGYKNCREYAIAIGKGLAEKEMCLPYLIEKLENAYTELKDTQVQLHNAEKLASIGQLAAGVAHELNNPLGTIMLYTSMMKSDLEKSEACRQKTDDLALVLDEAKRCKNIVSNLLNFARQGKLKISKFSIAELIETVVRTSIKLNGSNDIVNIYDETFNQEIEADKDQLKQVFINLVNNSFEAMEYSEEKKLDIIINKSDSDLTIQFKDKGCGIARENFNKLFTPFFTTKKIGRGTGLGLAISYGIIKMHKGDIQIESEINAGTTVTVKLPLKVLFYSPAVN
jgi:signal transduction histidine kinase/iron only hydrogenase large subunit-like protein